MLSQEQLKLYLQRINCENLSNEPSLENLNTIHESHLLTFSFGSVSIQDQCYVSEDPSQYFDKVIVNQQCGCCYELNYNFHRLLITLGYHAKIVQGQHYFPDPKLGPNQLRIQPKFSHALNIVTLNGISYVCEVGTADCIRFPIEFKEHKVVQQDGVFELKKEGDYYNIIRTRKHRYALFRIDPTPRQITDFMHRVKFLNYDPTNYFQQLQFALKKEKNGYRMIKGSTYIYQDNVNPENSIIRENLTEDECKKICSDDFKINLKTYKCLNAPFKINEDAEIIEVIL